MWQRVKNKWYLLILLGWGIILLTPSATSAVTNIQTSVCGSFEAPTITAPTTGVTSQDPSIIVSGGGEPNMVVTIIDNGIAVGMATITTNHTYAMQIPLVSGDNGIIAKEVDGCGTMKASTTVTVHHPIPLPSTGQTSIPSPEQPTIEQSVNLAFIAAAMSRPLNQPVSATPNTPGYAQPTVVQPTSGTTFSSQRIWVKGSAQPGSALLIYVNGISVARIEVPINRSYGALVELKPGKNSIQVRSKEQDTVLAMSEIVYITYLQPSTANTPPISIATVTAISLTVFISVGGIVWLAYGARVIFRRIG